MLLQMSLVIINDLTSVHGTTDPDVVAPTGYHLGMRVAKTDVMLILSMIVARALVAAPNRTDLGDQATTRTRDREIPTAMGDRNSDLHTVQIEATPGWAPWDVVPAVITPKRAPHVVTAEVDPNLDHKAEDPAATEHSAFHGDLDEVALR